MNLRRLRYLLPVCVMLGSTAQADCVDGGRKTTPEEQAFYGDVLKRIAAALPAAPGGWQVRNRSDTSPPTYVCNSERNDITVTYRVTWQRVESMEARGQAMESAYMESMKRPADDQARLDELMARQQTIMEELIALMQKGEYAAVEHRQAEIDAINAEMEAFYAGIETRMNQATAEHLRDTEASIGLTVNGYSVSLGDGEPETIAGMTAYRVGGNGGVVGGNWREGQTHLLLGQWEPDAEGRYRPSSSESDRKIRSIHVTAQAERSRATSLLEAIDLNALQALLNRETR